MKTAIGSVRPSTRKKISAPSERPIQLRCMVLTRSGQSGSRSRPVEQPLGVVGDAEEPLGQVADLHEVAGALAASVDDLLVGEHGAAARGTS